MKSLTASDVKTLLLGMFVLLGSFQQAQAFTAEGPTKLYGGVHSSYFDNDNDPLSGRQRLVSAPAQFSLSADELKRIAGRRVVLIIDRSSSMNTPDCPGELSRWEWCRSQAATLARDLSSVSSDGICIVPFNGSFEIYDHQSAEQVLKLFAKMHPTGRTLLAPPLRSQLITQLARQWGGGKTRPLLIAVITDGDIRDAQSVRELIEQTTERMRSADDIRIVFLSIGDDDRLGDCFGRLGDRPRFNIVQRYRFEDIAFTGLGKRLANAVGAESH